MNQINWIAWRLVSFLIHLSATIIYFYGLIVGELTYHDRNKDSSEPAWGRDWKFLTRWNFTIQLILMTSLLGIDLTAIGKLILHRRSNCLDLSGHGDEKSSSIVRRLKLITDQLIFSIAFPIGMFVTITFWILNAMGSGLVTSGPIKYVWLNHIVHTMVGPTILLELLITPHRRPKHHIRSMLIQIGFMITFICWLFFIYLYLDFWLYPIFGKLGIIGRIIFLFGCIALVVTLYWIGVAISKLFWSDGRVSSFNNPPRPLNHLDTTIMTGMSQNYNPE